MRLPGNNEAWKSCLPSLANAALVKRAHNLIQLTEGSSWWGLTTLDEMEVLQWSASWQAYSHVIYKAEKI
jgi:hypothetical protein